MSAKNRKGKAWKICRSNRHSGITSVIVQTGAFVTFEFQMHLWAVVESHGAWGSLNSWFAVCNNAVINKCINSNFRTTQTPEEYCLVSRVIVNEETSDRSSIRGILFRKVMGYNLFNSFVNKLEKSEFELWLDSPVLLKLERKQTNLRQWIIYYYKSKQQSGRKESDQWAECNKMQFSANKCKFIHPGKRNKQRKYRLVPGSYLENSKSGRTCSC